MSQTDIIRHIVNHPDSVTGLLDLDGSVQDLNLIQKQQVVAAADSETAIQVYRMMAEKSLSGVPVIDELVYSIFYFLIIFVIIYKCI